MQFRDAHRQHNLQKWFYIGLHRKHASKVSTLVFQITFVKIKYEWCSIVIQRNRYIDVKMKQHIYSDLIKIYKRSNHSKLYYILNDQKRLADKWVKPIVWSIVAKIGKDLKPALWCLIDAESFNVINDYYSKYACWDFMVYELLSQWMPFFCKSW